jgi:F-box and WD-40 domain protein CDC4
MRGSTLVTGGSDGSVRVWSLESFTPIHRLAAHDNSVTSLQFDATRIVSGGSDGRVKIWDLKTGGLIRELSQPAEAVWRVAFEEERSVVLASRQGRTVMEVWDFAPPEDEDTEGSTIGYSRPASAREDAARLSDAVILDGDDRVMLDIADDLQQRAEEERENVVMEDAPAGGDDRPQPAKAHASAEAAGAYINGKGRA